MQSDINFLIMLECEHCHKKTVIYTSRSQTEIKCAYSECGKMSKLVNADTAYTNWLEEHVQHLDQTINNLRHKLNLQSQPILLETNNGHRLILPNDRNSIQWTMTQNLKHLRQLNTSALSA